ncbi:tRNA uridine-5-carboxymethylaminomethyl(34) synthesis GTPase MnmE [Candidatus Saccharibacteria bacterium]|nr:tRNA uridine-5-carboxymethylaminomethyl(34) synthesis GTPase MnmE [Candidatus Saccharibacteria bacterium]
MSEPIIALSTAYQNAALAVIRLSGSNVLDLTIKLIQSETRLNPKVQTLANLINLDGKLIDQVTIVYSKAPRSFTGEDMVEITCHGSMLIVEQIIEAYQGLGVRLAKAGEFSQKAYLAGKLDLIQAEAISEMIVSNNSLLLDQARDQMLGGFSHEISSVIQELADLTARVNVGLDFSEEDLVDLTNTQIRSSLQSLIDQLEFDLISSQNLELLKNTPRVLIIGSPNAGKSSLFNQLLGINRAIVSDQSGTTRDYLESQTTLNGMMVNLIDTAGILEFDQDSTDQIELEGIRLAEQLIPTADLILHLRDHRLQPSASIQNLLKPYQSSTIEVISKLDQVDQSVNSKSHISISIKRPESIKQLKNQITARLYPHLQKPSLITHRQVEIISKLKTKLIDVLDLVQADLDQELIVLELEQAIAICQELTGKSVSDQVLTATFRQFCIGK